MHMEIYNYGILIIINALRHSLFLETMYQCVRDLVGAQPIQICYYPAVRMEEYIFGYLSFSPNYDRIVERKDIPICGKCLVEQEAFPMSSLIPFKRTFSPVFTMTEPFAFAYRILITPRYLI